MLLVDNYLTLLAPVGQLTTTETRDQGPMYINFSQYPKSCGVQRRQSIMMKHLNQVRVKTCIACPVLASQSKPVQRASKPTEVNSSQNVTAGIKRQTSGPAGIKRHGPATEDIKRLKDPLCDRLQRLVQMGVNKLDCLFTIPNNTDVYYQNHILPAPVFHWSPTSAILPLQMNNNSEDTISSGSPTQTATLPKLKRPDWYPAHLKPGDAIPRESISTHPAWSTFASVYTEDNCKRVQDTLDGLDDNLLNQLARPCEYLAQVRHFYHNLNQVFERSQQQQSLKWLHYIHPEIELHYDRDPTVSTPVAILYITFAGTAVPSYDDWQYMAKAEFFGMHVHKMEKSVLYVPVEHSSNIYHPRFVLTDPTIIRRYGTVLPDHPVSDAVDETSSSVSSCPVDLQHAWHTELATAVINEDLSHSPYWDAYFCNINNPGHPTLSPSEDLRYGHPEILQHEEDLLQRTQDRSMIPRNNGTTAITSHIATTVTGDTADADIDTAQTHRHLTEFKKKMANVKYCDKLNEVDAFNWSRLPKFSTLHYLTSPDSDVIYINGLIFRTENNENLSKIFQQPHRFGCNTAHAASNGIPASPSSRSKPVGFNTMSNGLTTYRLTIRLGVSGTHYKDCYLPATSYRNELEFDGYFNALKEFCINETQTGNDLPAVLNEVPLTKKAPLLSPNDKEYAAMVGITIPNIDLDMTTDRLKHIIKKRSLEISRVNRDASAQPRKKQRTASTPQTNTLLQHFKNKPATIT